VTKHPHYAQDSTTTWLLMCGILSSVWYLVINIFVPQASPDHSLLNHTVSELSAIDAPTRRLWLVAVAPYTPLFALFGWGVLRVAGPNRALRITGWVILVYCVFELYWPPMHTREVLAAGGGTLTDALHLVWAGVSVLLFFSIMTAGAIGLGRGFRVFSAVAAVLMLAFGLLTGSQADGISHNLPTPNIGLWERINIGVFLAWVVVFSVTLLRSQQLRLPTAHSTSPLKPAMMA